MNARRDLSIGQRLAVGFISLLALVAGLVLLVSYAHRQSALAQQTYVDTVAPRLGAAQELERTILYVALRLRRVFMHPDDERIAGYRAARGKAADALAHLQRTAGTDVRVADAAGRLEAYLLAADERVARYLEGTTTEQESALSEMREAALNPLREFAAEQEEAGTAALLSMGRARERVSFILAVGSALGAVGCVLLALLVARSVTKPTRELLDVAAALQAGDWQPALDGASAHGAAAHVRDEFARLSRAFGDAAKALQGRERRLAADGAVAVATAAALDRRMVGEGALRAVVDYAGVEVAVLYWREPGTDELVPVARHALNGSVESLRIGEGLPGAAARERRTLVVRDIPADTPFTVKLGYDQAPPRAVAAIPITFRDELHGVMVVAALHDFDDDALSFLDRSALQLGIGLRNAHSYEEIGRLLADVRDKNEQIQVQNEELQAQNEEIQAQHEELQAQAEELRAQNEELHAHTDQISRQGEVLAEADKRKNDFLGVLAHELRNPMAAILNCLGILKEARPGTEHVQRAQMMLERQAHHLIRLVDDLLDVTRISQGKIQLRLERLDLCDIVRACIEDHVVALGKRGLSLSVSIPDTPIWVRADSTRLSQVVGNLLSNSIKFTDPPGEVTIEALARTNVGPAVVRIADTGIGIHPAFMTQLFEPFWQSADTLDRGNGGLGLGLALVKSLVYLHGGAIDAHSDGLGKGTSFVIRLPLEDSADGVAVSGDGFGAPPGTEAI